MRNEGVLRSLSLAMMTHELVSYGDSNMFFWTAKKEYLVYDVNTILATAAVGNRTPYIKANDGKAIIVTYKNANSSEFGGNRCGVCLLSSNENAARIITRSPDSGLGFMTTHSYFGVTWYVMHSGQNARYGGATVLDTPYPIMDMNGQKFQVNVNSGSLTADTLERIMNEAGVRVSNGLDRPMLTAGRG